jgi:hypothetical protein
MDWEPFPRRLDRRPDHPALDRYVAQQDTLRAELQSLAGKYGWVPRDSVIDPESWTGARGEAVVQVWHHRQTATVTARLTAPGLCQDGNIEWLRSVLVFEEGW